MKPHLIALLILSLPGVLVAQLTPPAQPYVLRYGENTIARAPLLPELDPASPFTMEAWVFTESTQPYAVILGKPHTNRSSDPFMRFVIGVSPNGRYEVVHSTGTAGTYRSATATSAIVLKRWTHLAAVLSGTTMSLYVDGELAASASTAGASTSSAQVPFGVGAGSNPDGLISAGGFVGAMRQVRVWNKALTRDEIRTSAISASPGPQPGLAAAWPLDNGTGTSAAASNRSDATLMLGTSEGWGKPEWIRTGVLDSLDSFFSTLSTLPIQIAQGNSPQDLIPFDIDLDGDMDLIATFLTWPPTLPGTEVPVIVFRNNGGGQFTRVSEPWVDAIRFTHPRHWTIFDADKDGNKDLLIVDHGTDIVPFPGGISLLLKNGPGGSLIAEPDSRFPRISAFTHNVASGDFNGDGHIDVYMCNIEGTGVPSPRLLINNGSGSFTSTPQGLPDVLTSFTRKYMASAAADMDGDGDIDLVLGGHDGTSPNAFFAHDAILWNDGQGRFTFASDSALPPRSTGAAGGTVGISIGDLNGDGLPDIVMSTLFEYRQAFIQLLLANGDGTWRDASDRIPQQWPTSETFGNTWIRWVLIEDLNADARLDLVVVGNYEIPSKVYMNTGNAYFRDGDPFIRLGPGIAGVAAVDVDGDGRKDLATLSNAPALIIQRNLQNLQVPTSVENDARLERPDRLELSAWPNPFNPSTVVGFTVGTQDLASLHTTLKIYDVLGREVAVLVDGVMPAGQHSASFDASKLPSGVYLVRLIAGEMTVTRKVTLMK